MTPPVAIAADGRDPMRVVTRRIFALLVDGLLLALIPLATVAIVGNARIRTGACPDPVPVGRDCLSYRNQTLLVNKDAFLIFLGLLALLYLLVFVVVQGFTGASPGKALLGIRVVRHDGTSPGPLRSIVRAAAWVVDGFTLLLPVALWSAWFTPGHRRVGDWVAGTFVVRHPPSRTRGAPAEPVITESG
jgi:uncharacterized RDD family membrane protein YckC